MARPALNRFAPALAALLLWALAAGSALYWALHAASSAPPAAAATAAPGLPPLDAQAVARGLGAADDAPPAAQAAPPDARYALAGVVAHGSERGAALIAEQGQPPKPYRVGAKLPGGWTLQAVLRRSAVLDAGDGRQMRLQMPEPAPPARRAP